MAEVIIPNSSGSHPLPGRFRQIKERLKNVQLPHYQKIHDSDVDSRVAANFYYTRQGTAQANGAAPSPESLSSAVCPPKSEPIGCSYHGVVCVWGMPKELVDPPMIPMILLGLGVLAAMLTIGALVYMVLAWKDCYWSLAFRAYYTLVTVAAVAFVWFLNYWNLLGWRY